MPISLPVVISFQSPMMSLRAKWVMVQKRNMMQTALEQSAHRVHHLGDLCGIAGKMCKEITYEHEERCPGG